MQLLGEGSNLRQSGMRYRLIRTSCLAFLAPQNLSDRLTVIVETTAGIITPGDDAESKMLPNRRTQPWFREQRVVNRDRARQRAMTQPQITPWSQKRAN